MSRKLKNTEDRLALSPDDPVALDLRQAGRLVKDASVKGPSGSPQFLLFDGKAYCFKSLSFPEQKGVQGIVQNPQVIISWRESDDG